MWKINATVVLCLTNIFREEFNYKKSKQDIAAIVEFIKVGYAYASKQ